MTVAELSAWRHALLEWRQAEADGRKKALAAARAERRKK
jgi:hypothetical protein